MSDPLALGNDCAASVVSFLDVQSVSGYFCLARTVSDMARHCKLLSCATGRVLGQARLIGRVCPLPFAGPLLERLQQGMAAAGHTG